MYNFSLLFHKLAVLKVWLLNLKKHKQKHKISHNTKAEKESHSVDQSDIQGEPKKDCCEHW